VRNHPPGLKIFPGACYSFHVSQGNRFVVLWRGHRSPERGILRETFQYALRRNDFGLRNAVDQFVQRFAGHVASLSVLQIRRQGWVANRRRLAIGAQDTILPHQEQIAGDKIASGTNSVCLGARLRVD
jgi:hypothetical protein